MKQFAKFPIILFIISLFLIIGCQPQHDLEKVKTQVAEINDIIVKAMLENDQETVLKLYTEDAISMPSYEPMLKGMEAFKAQMEKQKDMPMNMQSFTLTSTDLLVSGNFVVDIGTYDLTMEMPQMPDGIVKDHGKYLTLFEIQKDGSLLMKVETWNTDTNPWEDMMAHQQEDTK